VRLRHGIALALIAALAGCGGGDDRPFHARVQTTQAGGTRIAWYERGHGPPLVMLIGTGSTMAEWDPAFLRLLAAKRRLLLFDYPGVGFWGPGVGARSTHSRTKPAG
jgi:hypothetical protein